MGELDRVFFRDTGEPVTRRQRAAIFYTETDSDVPEFGMYQGSWQERTDYSGTTHTRAGVCDLGFPGIGDNDKTHTVVRRLRGMGKQAAFLRGPREEFGNYSIWHIHMCDLDTRGMDGTSTSGATWQVTAYKNKDDGLVSGRADPLPWRPDDYKPFQFEAWKKAQELKGEIHLLTDRVENHTDNIDSLRKERDIAKAQLKRLIHERL